MIPSTGARSLRGCGVRVTSMGVRGLTDGTGCWSDYDMIGKRKWQVTHSIYGPFPNALGKYRANPIGDSHIHGLPLTGDHDRTRWRP